LANLYFGKAIRQNDHWKFAMTGIPVLVLDTGIHHRDRKLHIVLAEKGTGFVLWRDKVDHLTEFSMAVFSSFVTCTKQHGCEISVFFGGLNFVFCLVLHSG
jgi:hypothetical protein